MLRHYAARRDARAPAVAYWGDKGDRTMRSRTRTAVVGALAMVAVGALAASVAAEKPPCPKDHQHAVGPKDNYCMTCGCKVVPKKKKPAPAKPKPAVKAAPAGGGMVLVPAGAFLMGSPAGEGSDDERPQHRVSLDAFEIDRYEVTVAEYQGCVDAGTCSAPGTDTSCNWGVGGRERHPVNCIDWSQAKAHCEWAGKRLPTEAEWEKAARGTDGRKYPWGNQAASCQRAVMYDGGTGCGRNSTWPVGSKPAGASPYGAHDMAGNVWEWVADWYGKDYYASSPAENPSGPESVGARVVRGGAWSDFPDDLRAANRLRSTPTGRNNYIGVRCARTVSR